VIKRAVSKTALDISRRADGQFAKLGATQRNMEHFLGVFAAKMTAPPEQPAAPAVPLPPSMPIFIIEDPGKLDDFAKNAQIKYDQAYALAVDRAKAMAKELGKPQLTPDELRAISQKVQIQTVEQLKTLPDVRVLNYNALRFEDIAQLSLWRLNEAARARLIARQEADKIREKQQPTGEWFARIGVGYGNWWTGTPMLGVDASVGAEIRVTISDPTQAPRYEMAKLLPFAGDRGAQQALASHMIGIIDLRTQYLSLKQEEARLDTVIKKEDAIAAQAQKDETVKYALQSKILREIQRERVRAAEGEILGHVRELMNLPPSQGIDLAPGEWPKPQDIASRFQIDLAQVQRQKPIEIAGLQLPVRSPEYDAALKDLAKRAETFSVNREEWAKLHDVFKDAGLVGGPLPLKGLDAAEKAVLQTVDAYYKASLRKDRVDFIAGVGIPFLFKFLFRSTRDEGIPPSQGFFEARKAFSQ